MRGRVKRARAVVASTPGLVEVLASDWKKAAWFFARFGVTEALFRNGIPPVVTGADGPPGALGFLREPFEDERVRPAPESEGSC